MKKRTLTQEQLNILQAFLNGNNVLVDSVAGSGKTTLALTTTNLIYSKIDKTAKILYACFNKSIKEEMQSRLYSANIFNTETNTLHSIGLRALKKLNKPVVINAYKMKDVNKRMIEKAKLDPKYKKTKNKTFWSYLFHITNIFEFSRYDGSMSFEYNSSLELYEEQSTSINWTIYDEVMLMDLYNIYVECYKDLTFGTDELVVDFTDMIYLPISLNINLNQNIKYMIMDEVQDFNRLQHIFVDKIMRDSNVKQFIAVGDPKQSIYGFAGSNPRLFTRFLEKPSTVRMSMTNNFRCGYNIINYANSVYNNLQTVTTNAGFVNEAATVQDVSKGSLVIARKISTLLKGFFSLLSIGMPVSLKDENVFGTITGILNKHPGDYIPELIENLHYIVQDAKDPTFGDPIEAYKLQEELDILVMINDYTNFGALHKKDIVKRLKEIADVEPEGFITMCSIHKAKGLEADEVTIINIGEIPLESAKTPFQIDQEYNLKYVALTRAKDVLNLLNI